MMISDRIREKLKQSGLRGLAAAALRHTAVMVESGPDRRSPYQQHQATAHRVLSRYISFEGKDVLEVGGAQSCESMHPFLRDGAASAVVTGLDHISQEQAGNEGDLRIMRADALELSRVFGPSRFDVVYGLSIIEHIPSPELFLDEVHAILKPGGLAYFEGDPVWSSPRGHHLWVATWAGAFMNRTTANYLFMERPGTASTNPLPDWSHLLMTPDEMRSHLAGRSIPDTDADCIIECVYNFDKINRLDMSRIAEAYSSSRLTVLEANTARIDVPGDISEALRKRCGEGVDYGIYGVTYVLGKPS